MTRLALGAKLGPGLTTCPVCGKPHRNRPGKDAQPKPPSYDERALAMLDDGPLTTGDVQLLLNVEWPTAVDVLIRLRRRGQIESVGPTAHHEWRRRTPPPPSQPTTRFPVQRPPARAVSRRFLTGVVERIA